MLNVENVSLHYGAAQALRGVNVQVEKSRITCVLGRNGVGKTSLMRAIVGHQPLSSGQITFEGAAFGKSAAYERSRAGVAYVPQGREIFPLLTVRENLETGFAPTKRKDRYIPDHVYDLFPVLKDMLHRRGGDLSGGQQHADFEPLFLAMGQIGGKGAAFSGKPHGFQNVGDLFGFIGR